MCTGMCDKENDRMKEKERIWREDNTIEIN